MSNINKVKTIVFSTFVSVFASNIAIADDFFDSNKLHPTWPTVVTMESYPSLLSSSQLRIQEPQHRQQANIKTRAWYDMSYRPVLTELSKFSFLALAGYNPTSKIELYTSFKRQETKSHKNGISKSKQKTRTRTLFGATPIKFGNIQSSKRFSGFLRSASATSKTLNNCSHHKCESRFHSFANSLQNESSSFLNKVKRVNLFVNRQIKYRSDEDSHGIIDRWSLPQETMRAGYGDCEDYAILKMKLLASAGVPMKAMSIVILKDTSRKLYHAVLSIKTNAGNYILDNVTNTVRVDSQIAEYLPLYSVSAAGNFIYGFKSPAKQLALRNVSINAIAPGADIL